MTKSYIGFSNSRVLGNFALDTSSGTFTQSSSGSGTGNTRRAAEAASLNASNKAIFARILAKLGELLAETTLSEKELLNLITNNVTADSKVYELLELSQIATTKDGLNYVLETQNIIEPDQYCEVKTDQTLTGDAGTYYINDGLLNMLGQMRLGENSSAASGNGIFFGSNSAVILSGNGGITLDVSVSL
jgi:hypothetical protein